jgi:hypothetical protein
MKTRHMIGLSMLAGVALGAIAAVPASAVDEPPRSYVASPDVYKVIAQNDKTKVVLAIWPPGKRDNWHSHPANGVYFLTDCEARIFTPDGKFHDGSLKAGGPMYKRLSHRIHSEIEEPPNAG